ncbi:hypothetical protein F4678DRAFT_378190 [Xylaria arbuscula]|nr:hypothetical protein F4678DRAFT_378190 [Xylaria arbuscula]
MLKAWHSYPRCAWIIMHGFRLASLASLASIAFREFRDSRDSRGRTPKTGYGDFVKLIFGGKVLVAEVTSMALHSKTCVHIALTQLGN